MSGGHLSSSLRSHQPHSASDRLIQASIHHSMSKAPSPLIPHMDAGLRRTSQGLFEKERWVFCSVIVF